MRTAIILALLSGATIPTGDREFRVLVLGGSCDGVIERERDRGSDLISARADRGSYSFRANYLGRDARINYACDDNNRLKSGVYSFDFGTFEEAIAFFADAKSALIAELGKPYLDSSLPEVLVGSLAGSPTQEESHYLLSWAWEHYTITMGVIRRVSDAPETDVAIVYRLK